MHKTSRSAPRPIPAQDQWLACSDERHGAPLGVAGPTPIISSPCANRPAAATAPRRSRLRQRGFTLIEMLIATAVAGTLSSIAYPSFQGQVQKARRSDALVSMTTLQLAQERWRTNSSSYGSLAQIGAPGTSASGHYSLQLNAVSADGYEALATATGPQAGDSACRFLKLQVNGAIVTQRSGPAADVANPAATNRKCWGQ